MTQFYYLLCHSLSLTWYTLVSSLVGWNVTLLEVRFPVEIGAFVAPLLDRLQRRALRSEFLQWFIRRVHVQPSALVSRYPNPPT